MRFIKSQEGGQKKFESFLDQLVLIENLYSFKIIPDEVNSHSCVSAFSQQELHVY